MTISSHYLFLFRDAFLPEVVVGLCCHVAHKNLSDFNFQIFRNITRTPSNLSFFKYPHRITTTPTPPSSLSILTTKMLPRTHHSPRRFSSNLKKKSSQIFSNRRGEKRNRISRIHGARIEPIESRSNHTHTKRLLRKEEKW